MQVTETHVDGLKHEFKVILPAQNINTALDKKLVEVGKSVRMAGFRPGKAPLAMVKQRYGQSVFAEVLEEVVSESSSKALSDRGLRPALKPKIQVATVDMGKDVEYTIMVEVFPDIDVKDFGGLKLEKPVAAVDEKEMGEAVQRLLKNNQDFEKVDRAAQKGDKALIAFDGTVDGIAHPGMKADEFELELGSQQFIDTFEDQLVGSKAGEQRRVVVTFPENYGQKNLAGKEAVFNVTVKEVRQPKEAILDDAFAQKMGLQSADDVKAKIRERMTQDYDRMSRLHVKRQLLDRLAADYSFPIPVGMVDMEFSGIWARLQEEIKAGRAEDEKQKSEDALKKEYKAIAERRVRLGLLLGEIGRRNTVQVSQEEVNRAMFSEMQRFPGQERQVLDYFRNNPRALDSLRAPLFEDKVVDFILGQVKVTEKPVSVAELFKDPDADVV